MTRDYNASDYEITEVMLITTSGEKFDLSFVALEYITYEDITKPYCTGSLLCLDQGGWSDDASLKGTEKLIVKMIINVGRTPQPKGCLYEKEWIVHSVLRDVKTQEAQSKGSALILQLIDEHAMSNRAVKFSKTVGNGAKLESAISQICSDELGMSVKKNINPSIQSQWKAIIPYMHPLEACEWLRDRASTDTGMPFLFYKTQWSDQIQLATIDKLLEKSPWPGTDKKSAFKKSGSAVQGEENRTYGSRINQIITATPAQMTDTLQHIMSGTVGSSYAMTELDTGQIQGFVPVHFPVTEVLGNIPTDGSPQNVYDTKLSLKGVGAPHTQDSRFVHQALNKKTYLPSTNYKSIHWEADGDTHKNKLKTRAVLNMMKKNTMDVTVTSSPEMLSNGITVGDRVHLFFARDDMQNEVSVDGEKRKTGYWLILNMKQTFSVVNREAQHVAHMTVSKFNEGPLA